MILLREVRGFYLDEPKFPRWVREYNVNFEVVIFANK